MTIAIGSEWRWVWGAMVSAGLFAGAACGRSSTGGALDNPNWDAGVPSGNDAQSSSDRMGIDWPDGFTGPGQGGNAAASGMGGAGGTPDGPTPPLPGGDFTFGNPDNPAEWSGTPTAEGNVPIWVYPSNQTRFPRNIYRTLFQWRRAGYQQFRVVITGPRSNVAVYTDGQHPRCMATANAGCWEAGEAEWNAIAGANAGSTVSVFVDGLDKSGATPIVRRSSMLTIGFSQEPVAGAIFYWSTTSAGIRRANVAAAEPEDYITGKPSTVYTNPNSQVRCVGCHVVSRDGRYMAAPVQASSGNSLWVMEVTAAAPPKPLVTQVANTRGHGFATISPDNQHVVAAWGGKMWMVDLLTGMFQMDLPHGRIDGTHPDWSPRNDQLVFASGKGDNPERANLYTMSWNGSVWGEPQVLVQPPNPMDRNNPTHLFPMHSPRGDWIAYSRAAKGGHGDPTAQLWIVPSGGGDPIELINANRMVSNQMTDGRHQNDQPTWAPPGDLHWIAFNSKREYGVVLSGGTQQIWVAAIDLAKAARGEDPSYPAFRLQFQGLDEDNHRAFWTEDVRDPSPGPDGGVPPQPVPDAGMCIPTLAVCDPVADRCCDFSQGVRCDTEDNGQTYRCGLRID